MFTLIFITTIGTSTVPGLTDMECNAMTLLAPLVVAEQSRTSGRPISLIEATCQREI